MCNYVIFQDCFKFILKKPADFQNIFSPRGFHSSHLKCLSDLRNDIIVISWSILGTTCSIVEKQKNNVLSIWQLQLQETISSHDFWKWGRKWDKCERRDGRTKKKMAKIYNNITWTAATWTIPKHHDSSVNTKIQGGRYKDKAGLPTWITSCMIESGFSCDCFISFLVILRYCKWWASSEPVASSKRCFDFVIVSFNCGVRVKSGEKKEWKISDHFKGSYRPESITWHKARLAVWEHTEHTETLTVRIDLNL